MIGSPFLVVNRNGRRTLLNTAEIVFARLEDIDLHTERGKLVYGQYAPEQGTLYTVQLNFTGHREMEFIFTNAADQGDFYEQLLAAVGPAAVIETSAPYPSRQEVKAPESETTPRLYTREEVYMTHEEMMRGLEKAVAKQQGKQPPPAPASSAK